LNQYQIVGNIALALHATNPWVQDSEWNVGRLAASQRTAYNQEPPYPLVLAVCVDESVKDRNLLHEVGVLPFLGTNTNPLQVLKASVV
jgi:hypothetical protein